MTNVNEKQEYNDKSKEYICDANTHIKYEPKYKYNTKTTRLSCFDKYNKDNLHNYEISLSKTYEPNVDEIKSLRYAKEDLKKDLLKRIKSYKNIDIRDQVKDITFDNATIDMSKLPPLKDRGKKYLNTIKYEYSENYHSLTNYFKSKIYGDINPEKCQKYKPFYQKIYIEYSNVEDKLDKEYKKIEPTLLNNRTVVTVKGCDIDISEGISVYYKDNDDGTFNVSTLIRPKYIRDNFGLLELLKSGYRTSAVGDYIVEKMFKDSFKITKVKGNV